LSSDEKLSGDWSVDGTTGYDFLNQVNGLFVQGVNAEKLDRIYRGFSGCQADFRTVAYQGKKRVLTSLFISEAAGLAHRLKRLAESTRVGQDFTIRQLQGALVEIIARFPAYRTYA